MTVKCQHWGPVSETETRFGKCHLNYYGGYPSKGVCEKHCPAFKLQNPTVENMEVSSAPIIQSLQDLNATITAARERRIDMTPQRKRIPWREFIIGSESVGFGDTVKYWIEKVSFGMIKQKEGCGCERRQHLLNKWFPYRS